MKIAVLLSGGVDSTVAALLLKEEGHQVSGLTMINWDKGIARKARTASCFLGIEHHFIDLRPEFQDKVIKVFCQSYEKGDTPNPCVLCNREIKFGIMLEKALELGYEMVATGHYACIEHNWRSNRYLLKRGIDPRKEQSYFLYSLNQQQLARVIFPLGIMRKHEVKELARQRKIELADNRESQEICFIEKDYRDFLKGKICCQPGEVVDRQGNVLGTHRGLAYYTTGQRKGLGISAGRPVYVVGKDLVNNRLILDEEKLLYGSELTAENNNFIYMEELTSPLQVTAKIRYRSAEAAATIYPGDETVRVVFNEPQRAITPGQSIVYYQGDYVLGGGIITV